VTVNQKLSNKASVAENYLLTGL